MLIYIIKSTLCLAFFIGLYYLFLEREKMHQFNRFYLLSAIFLSLFIPILDISIDFGLSFDQLYVEYFSSQETLKPLVVSTESSSSLVTSGQTERSISNLYFWIGYLLVFVVLVFRFIKNLAAIYKTIRVNKKVVYKNSNLVLLERETESHTFFKYIFLNKSNYNSKRVADEVLTHELTHVKQLHTLDVILIELVHLLFWFNPLFIIYKKAIKLNHEFIADNKVVEKHKNVYSYQKMLIGIASNYRVHLVNNFNFIVTKKRLDMMNIRKNELKIIINKSGIIFLVFVLILVFSKNSTSQNKINKSNYLENITNAKTEIIKGKIVNEDGEGIQAIIIVRGVDSGVKCNIDGDFVIRALSNQILDISHKGYQSQEVKIGEKKSFNINLIKDLKN
ncbi:M56 family metallopeptidase [Flavivirga rizhaonensis]|uniref:Peptidase M56 domain-containing protein n=1 Tax=Flavivirga rizhaonensis TaxID=2559571 RepID=A0A4S1DYS5_9FLAO|nr:M56 family metallopeptidase [Flavivirga rizhaonensis]TGV03406.1 hypothetical protein EM932_06960 [Flavivirga rizhaonensis]